MSTVSPTRSLARFVADLRYDDIHEDVRNRVKDILLDTFASALAGHDASETPKVTAMARALGTSAESSIIGGQRLSAAGATLVNGYLITAVTVCDIHRPTSCHVTPEVIAPSLTAAEGMESSGRNYITAIATGLEVTTRIGLGLDPPAFRARGWHAPGVTGPFGGAAAVGKLLNLDAQQLCFAFGIAASQAAGTYAQLGTPTIKFQQSRGALSGLMAARLASEGFSAAEEILMHPDGGLFSAYADGGNPKAMLDGLGRDWELLRISLRAWPVAVHLQPVVTGLMLLISKTDIRPQQVAELRVRISEVAYRMHGTVPWDDRFRARLSAPYVTGVVLHDRRCWLEQFTPVRVADSAVDRFVRERVKVSSDPSLNDGTASIEIDATDGKIYREHVAAAKGEPSNALTHDEIVQKFRSAGAQLLSPEAADRAIAMTTDLEKLPSMRELSDCLRCTNTIAAT
jgi:2-methylcitrate dehydratase PrpD